MEQIIRILEKNAECIRLLVERDKALEERVRSLENKK